MFSCLNLFLPTATSAQTVASTGTLLIRNLPTDIHHSRFQVAKGCAECADCKVEGRGALVSGFRDINFTFPVPLSLNYVRVQIPELALLSCEEISTFRLYLYLSPACHDKVHVVGPLDIVCSTAPSPPFPSSFSSTTFPSSTFPSPFPFPSPGLKPTALAEMPFEGGQLLEPGAPPVQVEFPQVLQQDPSDTITIQDSKICFSQPGLYQLDFVLNFVGIFSEETSNIQLFLSASCSDVSLPNIAPLITDPSITTLQLGYPVSLQVTILSPGCCLTLNAQQIANAEIGIYGKVLVSKI